MKRLIIKDGMDTNNLELGGIEVNEVTTKHSFKIKKGNLDYTLLHVQDAIIVIRRTLKAINYDIFYDIENVIDEGYLIEESIINYFNNPDESVLILSELFEEAFEEPVVKKFSELKIEEMDKEKRVYSSSIETKNVVIVETDDFSYILFEDQDNNYYCPVEDSTQTLGYSILKIEEEFIFDCEIKKEIVKGKICDLGKTYIKGFEAKLSLDSIEMTYDKKNSDEIYLKKEGSRISQVYKFEDGSECKIERIELNGTHIYTYLVEPNIDTTGYEVLFKKYKSSKKNKGITNSRFDEMLGFFKY